MTEESKKIDLPIIKGVAPIDIVLILATYQKHKNMGLGMSHASLIDGVKGCGINENQLNTILGKLQEQGWVQPRFQVVGTAETTEPWIRFPDDFRITGSVSEDKLLPKLTAKKT